MKNFLKIIIMALGVIFVLSACRGALKIYPQTPLKPDSLQNLIGPDVVITSGMLASSDPTVHMQILLLKTSADAFIAHVSRSIYPTADRAKFEFARAGDRSGGRAPIQRTKQNVDYISSAGGESYTFLHENVLLNVNFGIKTKWPEKIAAPDARQQILEIFLAASRKR